MAFAKLFDTISWNIVVWKTLLFLIRTLVTYNLKYYTAHKSHIVATWNFINSAVHVCIIFDTFSFLLNYKKFAAHHALDNKSALSYCDISVCNLISLVFQKPEVLKYEPSRKHLWQQTDKIAKHIKLILHKFVNFDEYEQKNWYTLSTIDLLIDGIEKVIFAFL